MNKKNSCLKVKNASGNYAVWHASLTSSIYAYIGAYICMAPKGCEHSLTGDLLSVCDVIVP